MVGVGALKLGSVGRDATFLRWAPTRAPWLPWPAAAEFAGAQVAFQTEAAEDHGSGPKIKTDPLQIDIIWIHLTSLLVILLNYTPLQMADPDPWIGMLATQQMSLLQACSETSETRAFGSVLSLRIDMGHVLNPCVHVVFMFRKGPLARAWAKLRWA